MSKILLSHCVLRRWPLTYSRLLSTMGSQLINFTQLPVPGKTIHAHKQLPTPRQNIQIIDVQWDHLPAEASHSVVWPLILYCGTYLWFLVIIPGECLLHEL